jgi:exopolysaccharide production protein ExoQ
LNHSHPTPIAYLTQRAEYFLILAFLVIMPMLRGQFIALEVFVSGVMYSFIGLAIIQHWKRLVFVLMRDWGLSALMAFAILSVFWSANSDNTTYEFRFLVRSTFLGLYIASKYEPREIMRLLGAAISITIFLSLLTCLLLPQTGITLKNGVRVWVGIFTHKQACGTYMALAASFFTTRLVSRSHRGLALLGLIGALSFVVLSDSKTGLVICLLAIAITPLHWITAQKQLKGWAIAAALVIISLAVGWVSLNLPVIVVEFLGKDVQLTGRIPLWVLSVVEGLKRPWLGYGYAGFWSSDAADMILSNSWAIRDQAFRSRTIYFHAHNGFIDLFLQLGYIGLSLFMLSFMTFFTRSIRLAFSTQSVDYVWMVQFAIIFFVTNLTEALVILGPSYLWSLYVALAYAASLRHYQLNRQLHRSDRSAHPSIKFLVP